MHKKTIEKRESQKGKKLENNHREEKTRVRKLP